MDTQVALKALVALGHENRLAIYRLLVERGRAGLPAGQIADCLHMPQATASFHLKELTNAGLIRARPESRFIYYSANYSAMNALISYLTDNCCRAEIARDIACESECTSVALIDEIGISSQPPASGKTLKRRDS